MSLSADDLVVEAREVIDELTPAEAEAAMSDGAILVDTRCSTDRQAEGVIPGALYHHRTVLEWRLDPSSPTRDDAVADRSLRHIIMCDDGFSSALAAATLARMGFDRVAHLKGGYRAWATAGLPTVPTVE